MRFLFTFAGGQGHLRPMLPIATAAVAAGHTVAVAGQPTVLPVVQTAGLTAFDTGGDTFGEPVRRPLLPVDQDREDGDLREGFARRVGTERTERLLTLGRDWKPDLMISEEADFGAVIAAELLGVPQVTVQVMAAGNFVRPHVVAEPLNEIRLAHGLPADPDMKMLSRGLVLSPFPPSYRDPAFPLPPGGHAIRSATEPVDEPPSWLTSLPDAPTVYFSLGTVFNTESGDLFGRVLAGLRDLPVNVIVTVGPHIDPAEFGPQRPGVRIEQFIAQDLVLPHCAVMVSHGGSGGVMGALKHGVPLVVLPIGADQPFNARRCEELGVGKVLDSMTATPASVGEAVSAVLADESYRTAARRIAAENAALPQAHEMIGLLEEFAREGAHRPLAE